MHYLYTQATEVSTNLMRMVRFDVAGANQKYLPQHPCPHYYIRGHLFQQLGAPIALRLTTVPFTLGVDTYVPADDAILYTQQQPTAKRWRFVASTDTPLRYHAAPYYYISKTKHAELGRPLALLVTLAPVTLDPDTIFPELND